MLFGKNASEAALNAIVVEVGAKLRAARGPEDAARIDALMNRYAAMDPTFTHFTTARASVPWSPLLTTCARAVEAERIDDASLAVRAGIPLQEADRAPLVLREADSLLGVLMLFPAQEPGGELDVVMSVLETATTPASVWLLVRRLGPPASADDGAVSIQRFCLLFESRPPSEVAAAIVSGARWLDTALRMLTAAEHRRCQSMLAALLNDALSTCKRPAVDPRLLARFQSEARQLAGDIGLA